MRHHAGVTSLVVVMFLRGGSTPPGETVCLATIRLLLTPGA